MKSCRLLLLAMVSFISLSVYSNKVYMYRLYLSDKADTGYSINKPQDFLSQRSIDRRSRQGLKIDETDLPVSSIYLNRISDKGAKIVAKSKWNNSVVVQLSDSASISQYAGLPFIKDTQIVCVCQDTIPSRNKSRKKEITNKNEKNKQYYGKAFDQIKMHNGDSLHLAGFKGEGMEIAVVDGGFYNADDIKLLKDIKKIGVRNFVYPSVDVYCENNHGMKVLSCMATNKPHYMVGTAPEASYLLLVSECSEYEYPIEEDYWTEAVEYADSVGVDVINSSLGYYTFDNKTLDHKYRDLDGHTALISKSASLLADKGIVLVCSAGNSGNDEWKKITSPADAENVITVGAVGNNKVNAKFSSVGNTADGRVKPDVMATGLGSCVVGTNGCIQSGNGTSFASPIMCGLVACLWQSCPWLTAKELIESLRKSGDRSDYPDNIFGYGVPDVWKAYKQELNKRNK